QLAVKRGDGSPITVEVAVTALPFGDRVVYNAFIRDITDRLAVEAQLRHAQRMEALGQLTGGVAHDFNNLLTVVVGNLDLMGQLVGRGDPLPKERLQRLITGVQRAASRGERLTKQLLAFSRQSVLQPQTIDLHATIAEFAPFMQRAIGETVELHLDLAS